MVVSIQTLSIRSWQQSGHNNKSLNGYKQNKEHQGKKL